MNHIPMFKKYKLLLLALCCQTALSAQTPEFPPLDTLPALDTLADEILNEYAVRLASQASGIRDVFQFEQTRVTAEREALEQQLQAAKEDSTITAEDRKALEKQVKTAKAAEKAAQKQTGKAQKAADYAEKLAGMSPAEQRQSLPKARKNIAALLPKPPEPVEPPIAEVIGSVAVAGPTDLAAPPPVVDTVATAAPATDSLAEAKPAAKSKKDKKAAPSGPKFKSYDPAADVMLNPPSRACNIVTDTRDEFSGERRREMGKEELFRYTNPTLKPYFADTEHILCDAAIAVNNGNFLLNLTFTIRDVNARRAFGSLPRNGMAILKFLDGETLTVYNLRADEGQPDPENKVFSFRGQYAIEPGMLKKMQKTLLDKIRIAWSTGYEDYEVQNVDLLSRQLNCLLK